MFWKRKRPWGVVIFGLILIVSSIDQLRNIPGWAEYRTVNPGLSDELLHVRYGVSYLLRITGLICGIGVLFLNEACRRVLIGLMIFSITTIWLRHTYSSFLVSIERAVSLQPPDVRLWPIETLTWIGLVSMWIAEIAFSAGVIYYFTRKNVAGYFRKEP